MFTNGLVSNCPRSVLNYKSVSEKLGIQERKRCRKANTDRLGMGF